MIDYNKTIQELTKTITDFTFEYDWETVKSKMLLVEVPKEELAELGNDKIMENLANRVFFMQQEDGKVIDVNHFCDFIRKNNIKAGSTIAFNFKYVHWQIIEDITIPQLKQYIRKQLNNVPDLKELKKTVVFEETKNQQTVGEINGIQIKTSVHVEQGKFYIQSTCSPETAYKLIIEIINEIQEQKQIFIEKKIKRDKKYACWYMVFIAVISLLWFINHCYSDIFSTMATLISFLLFLAGFVIVRFINHSNILIVFCKRKAIEKYQKEYDNLTNE
jgi:hypothetical protein